MSPRLRSKAIQGLIAGTLVFLCTLPDAEAGVAEGYDVTFVEALLAEVERAEFDRQDRQSIFRRLALSPSRAIRTRMAAAAATLAVRDPQAGLGLLQQLAHDRAS